eukprot:409959-Hanusia_phi.AAC.1
MIVLCGSSGGQTLAVGSETCKWLTGIRRLFQVILATTRLPDAVVRGERNASLKQLRIRLAAVKSIQRITKTMKMVAAAKLKGFQGRMFEARPLGDTIEHMVQEIPAAPEEDVAAKDLTHLIVPITSDRGLCGGINGAVAKAAKALLNDTPGEKTVAIIGNKGEALLKRTHGQHITKIFSDVYVNPTSFALASEIAEELVKTTKYDKVDEASIIFNKFKSAIAYDTMIEEIESAGVDADYDSHLLIE